MRIVIVGMAVIALSLAACGRKEPDSATTVSANEKDAVVTSSAGGTVTTTTATPQAIAVAAAGHASTPDYAPVYPGATVKNATMTSSNGNSVGSVTYLTSATPATVIDFYKPKVTAEGFTTSADTSVGIGLMYAAVDPTSQRSMQVIATTEKNGTAVVLSWTTPKS